jgi:hypothetical protein
MRTFLEIFTNPLGLLSNDMFYALTEECLVKRKMDQKQGTVKLPCRLQANFQKKSVKITTKKSCHRVALQPTVQKTKKSFGSRGLVLNYDARQSIFK